jgi:hypothetical protein
MLSNSRLHRICNRVTWVSQSLEAWRQSLEEQLDQITALL